MLIEQATVLIQERIGTVVLASSTYETAPWGDFEVEGGASGVACFLNRALVVETPLTAHETLRAALGIEKELGRVRPDAGHVGNASMARLYHSRPMDIDLIFWDGDIIDTPDLQIPHPRAHLRRFVLEPMAELIPDYRHPVLGKTVAELLGELQV